MTLIASISGIRGTIGGRQGEGLSPQDIVKYATAYGFWLRGRCGRSDASIVLGRDARLSGNMVAQLVAGSLQACGISVIDIGLATTPTTEMAVRNYGAQGGVIVTASHNPAEWNALKLLNEEGEFLSETDAESMIREVETTDFLFPPATQLGLYSQREDALDLHIKGILELPMVDVDAIRGAGFQVAYDAINSVGGVALPKLFEALGVKRHVGINTDPNGRFAHNPEPLPHHLEDLGQLVLQEACHVGFAVDPDVDRLAIICEDGKPFGEEYTLVAVADFVLSQQAGSTVSNLSSTSALRDVTSIRGGKYYTSPVGEVNVVARMKEVDAIIGGEGNGGVILPALHYGRDALVGIAIFLTQLAKLGRGCRHLREQYPNYHIAKERVDLAPSTNIDRVLDSVKELFADQRLNTEDGVRIDMPGGWVHLRRSNTEPIIRVYAESTTAEKAEELAKGMVAKVNDLI